MACAVCERRPELVAHAHGHVMVHRLLLFCACDANHELAEIVDTQCSSCSRCAAQTPHSPSAIWCREGMALRCTPSMSYHRTHQRASTAQDTSTRSPRLSP